MNIFFRVQELYEYQKINYETSNDISNTLNAHESLSEKLSNHYDTTLLLQQNDQRDLEEELNKLSPSEKCMSFNVYLYKPHFIKL